MISVRHTGGMVMYSPTGWSAQYRGDHGLVAKAVERFSGDGEALVVHSADGILVPARNLPDFEGLRACSRTWSVVPCLPGWKATGKLRDYEDEVTEDVHAWLVNDAGNGDPLIVDREFATLVPAHEVIPDFTLVSPDEDEEEEDDADEEPLAS